jgi:hypothetical protein
MAHLSRMKRLQKLSFNINEEDAVVEEREYSDYE